MHSIGEPEERTLRSRYSYLSNQCLCVIKLGDKNKYSTVVLSASRALKMPHLTAADKTKLYYRRALAHIALNNDEDADDDLKAALKLSPQDAAVKAEQAKIAKRQKEKEKKQRAAYAKMFA